MKKRWAVIMAGGSGTRFWPKSSTKNPKQLLALTGKRTQLQLTYDRLKGVVPIPQRMVVATELLASLIRRQVPGIKILAEPQGRNTMAAVCWSAWAVHKKNADAVVALLPADAYVADVPGFQKSMNDAYDLAERHGRIVCLGIKPTWAATGYGYIQAGRALDSGFEISRFVEKPAADKAREFLDSGQFFWNAGIFIFPTRILIDEVRTHAPEFAAFFDDAVKSPAKIKKGYKKLPSLPFDVALMEKTDKGALCPGDFGWNDVGSWTALAEILPATSEAGLIRSAGGYAALESKNLIVDVGGKKFVGLLGVQDLIVVETDKALLICHRDKAQQIKDLVSLLSREKKYKDLV